MICLLSFNTHSAEGMQCMLRWLYRSSDNQQHFSHETRYWHSHQFCLTSALPPFHTDCSGRLSAKDNPCLLVPVPCRELFFQKILMIHGYLFVHCAFHRQSIKILKALPSVNLYTIVMTEFVNDELWDIVDLSMERKLLKWIHFVILLAIYRLKNIKYLQVYLVGEAKNDQQAFGKYWKQC